MYILQLVSSFMEGIGGATPDYFYINFLIVKR